MKSPAQKQGAKESSKTASRPAAAGPSLSAAPPAYGIDFVDELMMEGLTAPAQPAPVLQREAVASAPPPNGPSSLPIGPPDDRLEKEAERVAAQVMRMPAPDTGFPARPARDTEQKGTLRQLTRKESAGADLRQGTQAPPIVHEVIRSPGQPLSADARAFFQPRFGRDLGHVRVHTDARAAESADAVGALAYTVGSQIAFGRSQYGPASPFGQRLLAHELTHAIQQGISSDQSGDVTISSAASSRVQRFESFEHVQLGDAPGGPATGLILLECHSRDLPQRTAAVNTWPAYWQSYFSTLNSDQRRALTQGLTYGEVVALSGDMYSDFQALNRAPLREVIDLIPRIRSTTVTTAQLQAATGGRYLSLAEENISHFSNVPIGQRNRDVWRRNHVNAIAAARSGNANLAWGLNAAGDHFLTDAFSGGHLRVQRSMLHAQGERGDVRSKVLHDLDNQFGVEVTNDRGDHWIAYGDEHLGDEHRNDDPNARSRALATEAVQLSRTDIANALAQGIAYPAITSTTVFAAEGLIPQPISMTANRWGWGDLRREVSHLAYSEAPGIASELVGDDARIRDWINRTEPAALSRQSEGDVTRMLTVLLSLAVSDDDMAAIERLLGSVTDATTMSRLRAVFGPRAIKIGDFGLRARFRLALDRSP